MGFGEGKLQCGAPLRPAEIKYRDQQQNQPHELLSHSQPEHQTAEVRRAVRDGLLSYEPVDGRVFALANYIACQWPNDDGDAQPDKTGIMRAPVFLNQNKRYRAV